MSLSLFDLSGRIALVTGSSQGIGLAMAAGMARAGAHVVLNGRDTVKLGKAASALRDEGLAVSESAFDVTDSKAIEAAVMEIEAKVGPIDILINIADPPRRLTTRTGAICFAPMSKAVSLRPAPLVAG